MNKINEIVRHKISVEISRRFSGEIVSVTAVEVSRDLTHAKVWLSALTNVERVVKEAQAQAKEITFELAKTLEIKKVPQLFFIADTSSEYGNRVDSLIEEIKNDHDTN